MIAYLTFVHCVIWIMEISKCEIAYYDIKANININKLKYIIVQTVYHPI